MLTECPGILGRRGSGAVPNFSETTSLGCVLDVNMQRRCCLQRYDRTPVVAATACLVPFLLDPAAALGRPTPWAHEVAMPGSCLGVLAWCVNCGMHPAASVCVSVGKPPSSCLVVRPLMVAPPADRFCVRPGAAPCACSCFARVRPCAQGRCGRCSPESGVIYDFFSFSVGRLYGPMAGRCSAAASRSCRGTR